ncbi:MAG TPA: sigma-54-dependent Fis family transcriptional regulator [Marinobacter sp.]|nr:sigma-54-dependent Fis family transcriptional regulator [Marinobacter sp.]
MEKERYADYRSVISDSWNRCITFGLDHDHQPANPAPADSVLAELETEFQELRSATEAEVAPYYRNVLSNSRCLILLASKDATVLSRWGDERITDTHLKPWFQVGANWQEQTCGTNAIGTAIATASAVQIQRNEHFLKLHRSIIGSAAPIFDATRQLAGVLSVFSDAYLPQAHTLGMVRLLSQSVENRLIAKQHGAEHIQITLSTTADNFDSPWSGILVTNDEGQVVASNQRADQLLGTLTLGTSLDELFTTHRNHILGHPEHQPLQLLTHNKVRLSARIKRPTQIQGSPAKALPNVRANPAPKPEPITLDRLEFGDPAVRRCAEQGMKVLDRDVPLLITGETGVGKEVLVKALHRASERSEQPLVAVNCAAIPPELVESELFGYEAGAFTGARAQGAQGLIRKAHKGVLFLDEIGEMPLAAQSRLLRVLQERVVTPVGGTSSVPVDLLLVTATNRPLSERIETGHFRADLYYRINGLCVRLPPLRERADKRALIQSLYHQYREPGQPEALSPKVLATLENHPWPGNIRQLVNVLRVAVALADGNDIQLWHLPEDFLAQYDGARETPLSQPVPTAPEVMVVASRQGDAKPPLVAESGVPSQILQVYQRCNGNVSQTAKTLAISRNTLYKRLRELGVR